MKVSRNVAKCHGRTGRIRGPNETLFYGQCLNVMVRDIEQGEKSNNVCDDLKVTMSLCNFPL